MEMLVPRLRERATAKFIGVLRNVLPSAFAANVSEERLRDWPSEAEPDEITASLGLTGRDADVARAALESIRLVRQPTQTLNEAVECLVAAYLAAPNPQKRERILRDIVGTLKNPYSQPPGDALFLSAVAPRHDVGYFVYLRHLEQVWEKQIAIGPSKKASATDASLVCMTATSTHSCSVSHWYLCR